jgi:hypothetical protein
MPAAQRLRRTDQQKNFRAKNLGDAFGVPLLLRTDCLMLLFLLCLFLGCHWFYSPFHFSWKNLQRYFVATI